MCYKFILVYNHFLDLSFVKFKLFSYIYQFILLYKWITIYSSLFEIFKKDQTKRIMYFVFFIFSIEEFNFQS